MDQATIRRRLKDLRERRSVSQTELSQALGFNDRQTLSDIELGKRLVAPIDLVKAAAFFQVDLNYFTDPLELAGEACFSWRQQADAGDLGAFEQRAGQWIASYRHLSRLKGTSVNSLLPRVDLTPKSSFQEAAEEGEAVARALDLGETPAARLIEVLESRLDTLVLHVDTVPGVSGAACQLGPLNTLLVNRRESVGRRAFDLGHELFHLITWQAMPPAHIENDAYLSKSQQRIEKLANAFASGLLMPRTALSVLFEQQPFPAKDMADQAQWLRGAATRLGVSGAAVKWRLVALNVLPRAQAERMDDQSLRTDQTAKESTLPPRFSRHFVSTLGWGIEEGHLSVRRAADVIGTSLDDLATLFTEHGLKTPFEL